LTLSPLLLLPLALWQTHYTELLPAPEQLTELQRDALLALFNSMPHDGLYEALKEIRPGLNIWSDLLQRLIGRVMWHAIEDSEERVPLQLDKLLWRRQQLGVIMT
jgi:hypothetical protein